MRTDERNYLELAPLPTYEEFAYNCNSRFLVLIEHEVEIELMLVEVTEKKISKYQEQYSLFFKGKPENFLTQSIYHLKHDVLGNFDLFLVPVGKDEQGFLYEAAFNNLVQND